MRTPIMTFLAALAFAGTVQANELPQPPTNYDYGSKSDSEACGATLCLLGMIRDGDCDKYVTKYFSIIRTKKENSARPELPRLGVTLLPNVLRTRTVLKRPMTNGDRTTWLLSSLQ